MNDLTALDSTQPEKVDIVLQEQKIESFDLNSCDCSEMSDNGFGTLHDLLFGVLSFEVSEGLETERR